jgi:hypothetical protein
MLNETINEDLSERGAFALRLNAYEELSIRIVSALPASRMPQAPRKGGCHTGNRSRRRLFSDGIRKHAKVVTWNSRARSHS